MITSGRIMPEVAQTMGLGENLVYKWKGESIIQVSPEEKSVNSNWISIGNKFDYLWQSGIFKKGRVVKALVIFGQGDIKKSFQVIEPLS